MGSWRRFSFCRSASSTAATLLAGGAEGFETAVSLTTTVARLTSTCLYSSHGETKQASKTAHRNSHVRAPPPAGGFAAIWLSGGRPRMLGGLFDRFPLAQSTMAARDQGRRLPHACASQPVGAYLGPGLRAKFILRDHKEPRMRRQNFK